LPEKYRRRLKSTNMQEAGEEPVDEAAVTRFDRKRKDKRLSNEQWRSETDPDARIAKTKKGTTPRLAYKPEHVVDLETGVLLAAAEVHHADRGDTSTIEDTVKDAEDNLSSLGEETNILAVVADKGYHKGELITTFNRDKGIATYNIPEKTSSHRRRWHGDVTARREFHANRQRCRGKAGKRYARQRACLVERSFALFKRWGWLGVRAAFFPCLPPRSCVYCVAVGRISPIFDPAGWGVPVRIPAETMCRMKEHVLTS